MITHTVLNNKGTMYSSWLQEPVINLSDPTFTIPKNFQYELAEITEKYIARPDLVSHDIYGDAIYSDLLCKLNGISNPFELNKGMIIMIPSPDCIMDFMKIPQNNEYDYNVDVVQPSKPVSKPKNAKRKANEAVIGDNRFKIDRVNGIVIY